MWDWAQSKVTSSLYRSVLSEHPSLCKCVNPMVTYIYSCGQMASPYNLPSPSLAHQFQALMGSYSGLTMNKVQLSYSLWLIQYVNAVTCCSHKYKLGWNSTTSVGSVALHVVQTRWYTGRMHSLYTYLAEQTIPLSPTVRCIFSTSSSCTLAHQSG